MKYPQMFQKLAGVLAAEHASSDLQEFVRELSSAPIFDDDQAVTVIGDWTEKIVAVWEDGGEIFAMVAERNAMRLRALQELRGEVVRLPTMEEKRVKMHEKLFAQTRMMGTENASL